MRRAKRERRSIPLRNAQRDLLTRPDGRKRPVSAPGRFSRFRPIWGCGAHMDGRGEADADGAIGRIGPSHGTGACMGGRRRVPMSRHVRRLGPRRIASPLAAEHPPAPTSLGMSVESRAPQWEPDRESRETRKEIQGSQERQTRPSNSSGRPKTARFRAGPIFAISADFGLQGPNGRVRGGGRRRRNRANWAKPRRRRANGWPEASPRTAARPLGRS